jgi:methylenetetrahydrofolate dehydrogenase (NADP+)/methenyltetrahydrofolate cyclohydrolase
VAISGEGSVGGRIWDGGDIARQMLQQVRHEVMSLRRQGRPPPALVAIKVGDSAAHNQIQNLLAEACRVSGIPYQVQSFPVAGGHHAILQALTELSTDPHVTGITIDTPASIPVRVFAEAMTPEKDVDGWHPLTLGRLVSNTRQQRVVRGMELVHLLKQASVDLTGAHVICIGNATGLAGVFAAVCLQENATITAWRGSSVWPAAVMQRGDVILIDTGDSPPVASTAFKAGAVIIDARCSPHGRALWPDEGWLEVVSLLIPWPGGMGPATAALRLVSLVALYRAQECITSGS